MKKIPLMILLLIIMAGVFRIQAQSMVIKNYDGSEITNKLSLLQNFSFSDGNLFLSFLSGTSETYGVSTISKIYFKDVPISLHTAVQIANSDLFSLYPNPVNDIINLKNLPEGTSLVKIYRSDGIVVYQTQVNAENATIEASNLANGFYFIKINNQVIKFVKQ